MQLLIGRSLNTSVGTICFVQWSDNKTVTCSNNYNTVLPVSTVERHVTRNCFDCVYLEYIVKVNNGAAVVVLNQTSLQIRHRAIKRISNKVTWRLYSFKSSCVHFDRFEHNTTSTLQDVLIVIATRNSALRMGWSVKKTVMPGIISCNSQCAFNRLAHFHWTESQSRVTDKKHYMKAVGSPLSILHVLLQHGMLLFIICRLAESTLHMTNWGIACLKKINKYKTAYKNLRDAPIISISHLTIGISQLMLFQNNFFFLIC